MAHFFVALHKTSLGVPPRTPRSVLFALRELYPFEQFFQ